MKRNIFLNYVLNSSTNWFFEYNRRWQRNIVTCLYVNGRNSMSAWRLGHGLEVRGLNPCRGKRFFNSREPSRTSSCVRSVIELLWTQLFITRIIALLRCYAAQSRSYRCFGTTYRSNFLVVHCGRLMENAVGKREKTKRKGREPRQERHKRWWAKGWSHDCAVAINLATQHRTRTF